MGSPKVKAPAPKFNHIYQQEAKDNPLLNPDSYPVWTAPTDWTTPRTEIVTLTPQAARQMYTHANPLNNIRTKKTWVDELRSRMNGGKWSLMDTFEFDWNGVLGNGHHRTSAAAASDAVIVIQVSYGHNPENYYKYDDNFKRGNDTVIGLHRELSNKTAKKDAATISSALTWTHRYWDDDVQSLESRTAIYKEQRLEQDSRYPEMEDLLANMRNIAKTNKVKLPTQESLLLALYALGNEVNKTKTKEFIRGVIVGSQLDTNDPAFVYREFLKDSTVTGHNKGRIYTSFKVEKGLMALRYYFDGVKISRLVSRKGIPRLSAEHEALFDEIAAEKAAKRTADLKAKVVTLKAAAASA